MRLYHDAIRSMDRPLKKDDFRRFGRNTSQDYNELAQIYLEGGDYMKALEYTTKALELNDLDPVSNLNAGLIYYELVDYEKALYHLKWALWIERNSKKAEETRLGEGLLATPEPSSQLAIMALIDKAKEKADEEQYYAGREGKYDTAGMPHPSRLPVDTGKRPGATKPPEKERPGGTGKKAIPAAERSPIDILRDASERLGMSPYISELHTVKKNGNKVSVVVNKSWNDVPYKKQIDLIDKLWARWQGIKRKTGSKHGIYRIEMVSSDDEVIGGSNFLNTKVWALKP
ncbi:MAG: tetratricopeptide repeat protein [Planctomycetes bacterium]|nr:tetratricopeptide repeat protein [Planctomycetota bacterium]